VWLTERTGFPVIVILYDVCAGHVGFLHVRFCVCWFFVHHPSADCKLYTALFASTSRPLYILNTSLWLLRTKCKTSYCRSRYLQVDLSCTFSPIHLMTHYWYPSNWLRGLIDCFSDFFCPSVSVVCSSHSWIFFHAVDLSLLPLSFCAYVVPSISHRVVSYLYFKIGWIQNTELCTSNCVFYVSFNSCSALL